MTSAHGRPPSSAAEPGSSIAWCQVPPVSAATNAWVCRVPSMYQPPATQVPAAAHDTDVTLAWLPWSSAAVPGTSIAWCQVPPVSEATNAWRRPWGA